MPKRSADHPHSDIHYFEPDTHEYKQPDPGPLIGRTRDFLKHSRGRVTPLARRCGCYLRTQARKIHERENWSKRCSVTLIDNSAGLAMGMLAAHLVQSSVETRQFDNLWGLLASKPIVSESTFQTLTFSAEFVITVIVFTLTEHFIAEYRQNKAGGTRESAS